MKIVNENGIEIKTPDLSKGYLIDDTETIHHDAVKGTKQKSHYEVIKEYENGGKDLKEVIDIAGVEPKDAYDEKIEIKRYILYTEDELKKLESQVTLESRLKATEDALMAIMIGGGSNV